MLAHWVLLSTIQLWISFFALLGKQQAMLLEKAKQNIITKKKQKKKTKMQIQLDTTCVPNISFVVWMPYKELNISKWQCVHMLQIGNIHVMHKTSYYKHHYQLKPTFTLRARYWANWPVVGAIFPTWFDNRSESFARLRKTIDLRLKTSMNSCFAFKFKFLN